MKVLAINNGRDHTAYTFMERNRGRGYSTCSDFLDGDITKGIKDLCRRFQPDEIVLQLPPTGLDARTQKAIQAGFGRNVATAFSLRRNTVMKDLLRTRAAFGWYTREDVREVIGRTLACDHLRALNRRHQMQLLNTVTLAYDSVKAAERAIF